MNRYADRFVTIEEDMGDGMRRTHLQIRLVYTPQFRLRWWLAKQLIALSSIVGGFGIEFMEADELYDDDPPLPHGWTLEEEDE